MRAKIRHRLTLRAAVADVRQGLTPQEIKARHTDLSMPIAVLGRDERGRFARVYL